MNRKLIDGGDVADLKAQVVVSVPALVRRLPPPGPLLRLSGARTSALVPTVRRRLSENAVSYNEAPMNSPLDHPELFATYKRAKADAEHKFGLIRTAAKKGPKAVQAAVDTSARADKRRDSFAKKLRDLGVVLED
ncbi:hypothetical protein [Hydrogenophaga crassostreae]|nr:hypothetical protein [Hydrogenophaga crassostreae]